MVDQDGVVVTEDLHKDIDKIIREEGLEPEPELRKNKLKQYLNLSEAQLKLLLREGSQSGVPSVGMAFLPPREDPDSHLRGVGSDVKMLLKVTRDADLKIIALNGIESNFIAKRFEEKVFISKSGEMIRETLNNKIDDYKTKYKMEIDRNAKGSRIIIYQAIDPAAVYEMPASLMSRVSNFITERDRSESVSIELSNSPKKPELRLKFGGSRERAASTNASSDDGRGASASPNNISNRFSPDHKVMEALNEAKDVINGAKGILNNRAREVFSGARGAFNKKQPSSPSPSK